MVEDPAVGAAVFGTREHRRETVAYNSEDQAKAAEERAATLTEGQRAAFDDIKGALNEDEGAVGANVFSVDGPGVCGKTNLYETLLNLVRGNGDIAVAMAMSGIAALLLEGGRTAHSRFRSRTMRRYSSLFTVAQWACCRLDVFRVKTMFIESRSASSGGGSSIEGISAVGCAKKMVLPLMPFCCKSGAPFPSRI